MQRSYSSLVETSRVSSFWVDLSMELNNGSAPGFGLRRGMGRSKDHTTQLLPQHRAWRPSRQAGASLFSLLITQSCISRGFYFPILSLALSIHPVHQ